MDATESVVTVRAEQLRPGDIVRLGGVGYVITLVKLRGRLTHIRYRTRKDAKRRSLTLRSRNRFEILLPNPTPETLR